MKTITMLWIGAALLLAADQDQDKKPVAKPASAPHKAARPQSAHEPVRPNLKKPTVTPVAPKLTAQQQAAAALPTVPEGAKEVGPNLYRTTDAAGKNWLYRKTPFGVSKWEEKPGDQEPVVERASAVPVTARDLGDSVEFQRPTPFGPQKWVRKKSELTEEEKATLAAAGEKPADTAKHPEKQ